MKKTMLLILIFSVFLSFTTENSIKTFDLESAIANNSISYQIQGNIESPHYYQPVRLTIKNLTDKAIQIQVPNGQRFKSIDSSFQDIVITKEQLIALAPKSQKEATLFGMCTEKYNAAPNENVVYVPNGLAEGNLGHISSKIEQLEAYDITGQNAIWMITDDSGLADIYGYDAEAGAPLRNYMASLLNIPEEDIEQYIEPQETVRKRTVGGNFRYKFSNTSAVTIGMFNEQDIIVKELYNNPETPPGEHRLSYEFDTLQYGDDIYYIRLIINGQIKINFEMKPRGS